MFDKEYTFKGSHARKVSALTYNYDETLKSGLHIFETNLDVYLNAPVIGFLYGRKADIDNTRNPDRNEVYTTKIFGDKMISSQTQLLFNYRLIMLLDKAYEPDIQKRITKAFRKTGENAADIELYESYVRGGIDVLYEKILDGAESNHEIIDRLIEFIQDFQDRFNRDIDMNKISEMCRTS